MKGIVLYGIEKVKFSIKRCQPGTSLVVQWVRLHTPNAGGLGSVSGQGASSHMHAATKSPHVATKIPRAATKTRRSLNK